MQNPTNPCGVVIYGPQACGKTRNAAALARHFGLTRVLDGDHGYEGLWEPGQPAPAGCLVLTGEPQPGALQFADLAAELNLA